MKGSIYVASRASVPERAEMWRVLRLRGWPIVSTWIDEAGEGETDDFTRLWARISAEIAQCDALVLYAERSDFPLKGALIEAGIALGMAKPVYVCLPDVLLDGRTDRPIGSWVRHPLVKLVESLDEVLRFVHEDLWSSRVWKIVNKIQKAGKEEEWK